MQSPPSCHRSPLHYTKATTISNLTRVLVLHPDLKRPDKGRSAAIALEEAVSLAHALELEIIGAMVVPLPKPKPGTLFGTGKVEELAHYISDNAIELVVIDGPVTPVQQRNLERAWKTKILDRTGLILEIFGDRAQTREGVLQVELAHLNYQKTRLVRSWTHLERQRGGLGFVGGPGETQIEADRRALNLRVDQIRQQLDKVVKTRNLHRKSRKRIPYPIVALVGYTNAGKSTLFNRMTGASVLAEDMLFATLDPTMRAIDLPGGQRIILSDTVGFISDLPTELVAAFRATLEEVLDADLVIHVRDISHPESDNQSVDVVGILESIGLSEDRLNAMFEVWNKLDLLPDETRTALERSAARTNGRYAISALTGEGFESLVNGIEEHLQDPMLIEKLKIPLTEGRALAWLQSRKLVTHTISTENGITVTTEWSQKQKNQFLKEFETLSLTV